MNRTTRISPAFLTLTFVLGLVMLSALVASATSVVEKPTPPVPQNDSLTCEIHRVGLVDEDVRIAYGLPAFNEQARAAMRVQDSLFPHAVPYVLGGCIIEENSPKTAHIHYCPVCRVARDAWLKGYDAAAHPDEEQQ